MASIQLKPPDPFDFKSPDDWPRWRKRYEQFQVASGLGEEIAAKQVSTFLYCLGEEAESVLVSICATEDDRKDYAAIVGKFEAFFRVRRNVIFERARFNRRNQQYGETSEQYIVALYALAANCEYGALESEMIRDRLVVGIRDTGLSEKLQLDADLTLDKAKKSIRQREAVREQQGILGGADDRKVDSLRKGKGHEGQPRRQRHSEEKRMSSLKHCTRCGKEQHARDRCPAKDAVCHNCQKKGHYSSQCRSKVRKVDESNLETTFLDATASSSAEGEMAWFSEILVGKQTKRKVTFKLDTGAEVTAVSHSTYKTLQDSPKLRSPQRTLCGPSQKPLQVVGQCKVHLTHGDKTSEEQLFVVKGLRSNLLGLPAIKSLNLAARLDVISKEKTPVSEAYIHERFKKLFQGLGNLGEEYNIRLKPDAAPFALFTPRRVPLPLRERVSEELHRMETMGVISRVDVPSPWCAGMVVAPKKSGAVRICVDLKPLNQSVLREVHPLPFFSFFFLFFFYEIRVINTRQHE